MAERAVDADAASGPTDRPSFVWGATTHVGGARDHNEDAFYVSDDVCVVADGMGGHQAGEVASQLVTKLVSEVFTARRLDVTELPRFVSALNAAVLRKGAENNTQGMGTTLVGVAVANNGDVPSAVVLHVGDSRCYRLVDGVLTQLTTDHSHVQDLIDIGRITPAEALTHPLRNVITRALGAAVAVKADFHVLPEEDCRLLLCSDGLSGEIDDDQILELLAMHADPSKAAVALVEAVLEGPARDNVTVIVVDVRFPGVDPDAGVGPSDLQVITASVEADVTAEVEAGVAAEAVAEITAEVPVHGAGAAAIDPAWAPPAPDQGQRFVAGRPPAPPNAAAWGAPNPPSTDPTP
jgi:protein phosphatase